MGAGRLFRDSALAWRRQIGPGSRDRKVSRQHVEGMGRSERMNAAFSPEKCSRVLLRQPGAGCSQDCIRRDTEKRGNRAGWILLLLEVKGSGKWVLLGEGQLEASVRCRAHFPALPPVPAPSWHPACDHFSIPAQVLPNPCAVAG